MTARPRPGHAAALLLFTALAALFWLHRIHVDRPSRHIDFADSDLVLQFHPNAVFIHDELRAGRLPLWNPFQFAGQPFLALHMPAPLYPLHALPLWLLQPARALELHAVVHLALSGFLTWLLARRLGLAPLAALAAALSYLWAGQTLTGIYGYPMLATRTWLPGVLWATHGLTREVRPRWAFALAGCLGLAFLGGFAQAFLYAAQLGLAFGVFGLFAFTPPGARWRALGLACWAGLLTVGLCAPQLLPALQFSGEASRALSGLSLEQASSRAIPPATLLEGLLGQLAPEPARIPSPLRWGMSPPLLFLPLALCAGLARRQRAALGFFAAATLGAALFVLGDATPVFRLYHRLPLGDAFRIPARAAFVYTFCAGIVTAIGVQGIADALTRRGRRRLAVALPALLVLGIGADLYARSRLDMTHPVLAPARQGAPAGWARRVRPTIGQERVFLETRFGPQAALLAKAGTLNRLFTLPDYEPSLLRGYFHYFQPRELWHGHMALTPLAPLQAQPQLRLLDLMSVRFYTAANARTLQQLRQRVGGERLPGSLLLRRRRALPRVYAVHDTEIAPEPRHARARLLEPDFDAMRSAVLERAIAPLGPAPDEPPRVTLVSHTPQRVEIEATCASPCLLVLTDAHYPGWRAEVDGAPAELLRVNLLYRGLRLEAGSHHIVQRYVSRPLQLGFALLLVSWAGSGLALAARPMGFARRRLAARGPTPESGS